MKGPENTLDSKKLADCIENLRKANGITDSLYWVDNEHFYKSSFANNLGFQCTQEELDNVDETGFIKRARGCDLYLSKLIPSISIK